MTKCCFSRLSEGYIESVVIYFDKYIIPYFGVETPVNLISASMISHFGSHLVEQGLSTNYANKIICNLSKLFKWAAKNNWLPSIPYISRLPVQKIEHGYELYDNEIDALLTAAKDSPEHVQRFVVLCLYCGLRHGEALSVRWGDVDFKRGIIHLSSQKNRSDMPAPLSKAREMLEAVPLDQRSGTIVVFKDFIHGGTMREIASLKRAWGTLRDRAGLPATVRIHDLRHTFVSRVFRLLGYDALFYPGIHQAKRSFDIFTPAGGALH
jgi:integrase